MLAQEQSKSDQVPEVKEEVTITVPDLADIIPLATELSGRLATLENKITGVLDVSEVERKYDSIRADLEGPAGQLQRLKESKDYSYRKLVELREVIETRK